MTAERTAQPAAGHPSETEHEPGESPPTPRHQDTAGGSSDLSPTFFSAEEGGVERARLLASDLVRELAEHAGDPDGVLTTLQRWFDVLDTRLFGVCLAAVQLTYADCLAVVPDVPPGATAFTAPPPEGTHT